MLFLIGTSSPFFQYPLFLIFPVFPSNVFFSFLNFDLDFTFIETTVLMQGTDARSEDSEVSSLSTLVNCQQRPLSSR